MAERNSMDRLDRLHPVTLFFDFLCVMLPAMFCVNPVVQGVSLLGAVCLYLEIRAGKRKKEWAWMIVFFLILFLLYPLMNHNGKTALFYINGNRITLEAVCYGGVMSLMMAGILIWCRSLSLIMTSDRIVYLLGSISPKAALLCSMTLRFVPMFRRQMAATRENQKLLGLYGDGTLIDRLRAELYLFSAMVTWSFEHSLDTADSMQARGFGTGKRSRYTDYRMRIVDFGMIGIMLLLTGLLLTVIGSGRVDTVYYPGVVLPKLGAAELFTYLGYLLLCLLLPGYQMLGRIKK